MKSTQIRSINNIVLTAFICSLDRIFEKAQLEKEEREIEAMQ